MVVRFSSFLRNPFSFLFAGSSKEGRIAAYVIREHDRLLMGGVWAEVTLRYDSSAAADGGRDRRCRGSRSAALSGLLHLLVPHHHDLARLADLGLERLDAQRRAEIGLDHRQVRDALGGVLHAHLGDRHLQRLLGLRPLLAHVEQEIGRVLSDDELRII